MKKMAIFTWVFILSGLVIFQSCEKTKPPAGPANEIVIQPIGNEMRFATREFTVKAGSDVRIIMDNIATSDAMKHNVVILKIDANIQDVGLAATKAGENAEYVPDHEAILFYTPLADPGEKTEVSFTAPPPGEYPFVCTYPGHWLLMKGVMHSVE